MNTENKYFDLIEDYLDQNLSKPDLQGFEKAMGVFPDLKEEVQIQKGIRQALSDYRAGQLKQRLSEIPIQKSSALTSAFWGIAASVGVAVISVLVGGYAYVSNLDQTTIIPIVPVSEVSTHIPEEISQENRLSLIGQPERATSEPIEELPKISQQAKSNALATKTLPPEKKKNKNINRPQISEPNDFINSPASIEVPNSKQLNTDHFQQVKVKILPHKGRQRYQLTDNQLTLFGNFDNVELLKQEYDILSVKINGSIFQLKKTTTTLPLE